MPHADQSPALCSRAFPMVTAGEQRGRSSGEPGPLGPCDHHPGPALPSRPTSSPCPTSYLIRPDPHGNSGTSSPCGPLPCPHPSPAGSSSTAHPLAAQGLWLPPSACRRLWKLIHPHPCLRSRVVNPGSRALPTGSRSPLVLPAPGLPLLTLPAPVLWAGLSQAGHSHLCLPSAVQHRLPTHSG